MHVKKTEDGLLAPVFIGQSENLNHRFLNEEMQKNVDAGGATQLHLHANYRGEQARIAEAEDLIARWQPVCNGQG